MFIDLLIKRPSFFRRKFFGIRYTRNRKGKRKNHGGGYDRAGQGTPAGLINACNPHQAALACLVLKSPQVNAHVPFQERSSLILAALPLSFRI